MTPPLRIVMLMRKFYPLTGGYQNQALRLAVELRRRGITVDVVTQRHGTLSAFEVHEGIPIHRVFAFRSGHLAAWSYLASAFLWMLRRRRFDLIHANRSSSGLVAGLIGRALGKPVLYKLTRGDEIDAKSLRSPIVGRLKVWCLHRTIGRFVAITDEIRRDLVALGIPAERITPISNGIRVEERVADYDRRQVKAELGWDADTPVVTFVGRLVREKGVDWLLDAWPDVVGRHTRARLLVVGDGAERAGLEARARALGLEASVVFVGRQEDVFRFLAVTDVFVLPSREEGISNALLEAMSQGLPVVVADDHLGGNRGVIEDGRDGWLVKPEDGARLAELLVQLLGDAAARTALGWAARERIAAAFSIEAAADRYCRLYAELLGRDAWTIS